jgi:hypothetical protein
VCVFVCVCVCVTCVTTRAPHITHRSIETLNPKALNPKRYTLDPIHKGPVKTNLLTAYRIYIYISLGSIYTIYKE